MKIIVLMAVCLFWPTMAFSAEINPAESIHVCFTPGQNCTGELVQAIGSAKQSILVQAYSFTSKPIADALVDAKHNGVDVKVILDKSQVKERNSVLGYLASQQIPIWIDNRVAIAHNKVMIFDEQSVSTGSFNFTNSAQKRNAENLLILKDSALAQQYAKNWYSRQYLSQSYGYT
jgi:phosphatidylserine/phosphatidylglycerophosphate/cardiolipin synthase-like enzyme